MIAIELIKVVLAVGAPAIMIMVTGFILDTFSK
jgi:hypothetical protein